MTLDLARLLLFPALMAFAAASDLFTMTISNRVSLALVAGFFALALAGGMAPYEVLGHVGAGALVLVGAFTCFAMGWVGGGDAKVAASVALWFGFAQLMNFLLYASLFGGPGLARTTARQGERHSLRHRARTERADGLPGDRMGEGDRPRSSRTALNVPGKPGVKPI
jgi:prepilin signal peptidase PulO-like enzyme (type II secretory pathway)